MGHMSPHFHVIYDNLFSIVLNAETGGLFDLKYDIQAQSWAQLIEAEMRALS